MAPFIAGVLNLSAINSSIFQNGIKTQNNIENYAFFGNVEYEIVPKLTAKGGIRYTKSSIKNTACGTDAGDGNIANMGIGSKGYCDWGQSQWQEHK